MKRELIVSSNIMMFKVDRFDAQGHLNNKMGDVICHEYLDMSEAMLEHVEEVFDQTLSSKVTLESQYNYYMQKKLDNRMKKTNQYEFVAVICHTGRSQNQGEYYSYVKRRVRREHLDGEKKNVRMKYEDG